MTGETSPDELITVAQCRGCEQLSLAGDLERFGHPQDGTGDQLGCPRCGTHLTAEDFYDFVDLRVVEYGK